MTTAAANAISRNAGLAVQIIRAADAFQRLAPEWMELFERSRSEIVFLTFDWIQEWWARWNRSRTLFIITVRNAAGELVALAPFAIQRSSFLGVKVRAVTFLGAEAVGSDHLDVLVAPGFEEAALREVASGLMRHCSEWDYLDLADTDEDSRVAGRLRELLTADGMRAHVVQSTICPYLPLPRTFEAFLASLGSNMRCNFRRRVRVLAREGPVEFCTLTEGSELERGFEDLMNLHRQRSEQRGRDSTFIDGAVYDFHRSVLPRLARRGRAALHMLKVRGQVVAALYSFSSAGRFMFFQCGMDPAWLRFAVGVVTLGNTINAAIATGHHEYDFLRGGESYKANWTKQARIMIRLRMFDNRWRGRLVESSVHLTEAGHAWKRSIYALLVPKQRKFTSASEISPREE
jgi:CelD/BcsL family acetyltransferase involved in cellulose biosynthesis